MNYAMTDEEFAQLKTQGIALFNLAIHSQVSRDSIDQKSPPQEAAYEDTTKWLEEIEKIENCAKCTNRTQANVPVSQ